MTNEVAHIPRPSELPLKKIVTIVAVLSLLGFLANRTYVELAFDVDFTFGSIFSTLAVVLLGRKAGCICALIAASQTYLLWNHPYAAFAFVAEAFWIGTALERDRNSNLLVVDTSFWLLAGIPLVALTYGGIQRLGLQVTAVIALKQTLNGILNTFIAKILVSYTPLTDWLGIRRGPRLYPIGIVIFDAAMFLLLVPSIWIMISSTTRESELSRQRTVTVLTTTLRDTQDHLQDWVTQHANAIQVFADEITASPKRDPAFMDSGLRRLAKLYPDFLAVLVGDSAAKAIAFFPLHNDFGQPTIGLDFSDHSYVIAMEKTHRPVISEVFVGRRAKFRPLFTISSPLLSGNNFNGFVTGAVDLDQMHERLEEHNPVAHVFLTLVDARGNVITSTDPHVQPLATWAHTGEAEQKQIGDSVVLMAPVNMKNVSVMRKWSAALYQVQAKVAGTDWTLVATLPAETEFRRTLDATLRNLFLLLLFYVIMLISAVEVSRRMSQAPVALANLSHDLVDRVERGAHVTWPETKFEELATIVSALRSTAEAAGKRLQDLKSETELRVNSERALLHQSRLAAMGETIGNIAHQWRQPLNALSMIIGNLKDAAQFDDFDAQLLKVKLDDAERVIHQMSLTIDDFRRFSKPGESAQIFSAAIAVQHAVNLAGEGLRQSGVDICFPRPEDVYTVGCPNEYSNVVLNILENARDAIVARGIKDGRILIQVSKVGGACMLQISDNGGGISEDIKGRIFEPYFTTKSTVGTGLGLYIAMRIVTERMKGTITASNTGEGAEFTICTPLSEKLA